MSETKRCARCGQQVAIIEFTKSAWNRDGFKSYCRSCVRAYEAQRRRANGAKPRPVRRVLEPGSTKECRTCHRVIDVSEFYTSKSNSDGYRNDCKVCDNQKTLDWLHAHPKRRSEIQRKYYYRKKAASADASTESDT